jgi:hypothetical protein
LDKVTPARRSISHQAINAGQVEVSRLSVEREECGWVIGVPCEDSSGRIAFM